MAVRIGAFVPRSDQDSFFRFLKQYGVDDVLGGWWVDPTVESRLTAEASLKEEAYWQFLELLLFRTRCEDAGLRLASFENPVPPWCYDRIMLGQPGRDEQIANLAITIRNMGRAGIPVAGYHWMANPPGVATASWRTSLTTAGRGGAQVTSFDLALAKTAPLSRGREYSEEEMWANYEYFIRKIIPVCEDAGVRLALHPDDPPLAQLGGIPRLFHSPEGYQRAMDVADNSPASGINLCLGNWTAMGTDIPAAIRHFGSRGQIVYGHAQGVQGAGPAFKECFLEEADCDFQTVIETLDDVGFDGPLCPAHLSVTVGDSPLQHQSHAYAFGYLRGLIKAVARPQ